MRPSPTDRTPPAPPEAPPPRRLALLAALGAGFAWAGCAEEAPPPPRRGPVEEPGLVVAKNVTVNGKGPIGTTAASSFESRMAGGPVPLFAPVPISQTITVSGTLAPAGGNDVMPPFSYLDTRSTTQEKHSFGSVTGVLPPNGRFTLTLGPFSPSAVGRVSLEAPLTFSTSPNDRRATRVILGELDLVAEE